MDEHSHTEPPSEPTLRIEALQRPPGGDNMGDHHGHHDHGAPEPVSISPARR
jgi:hypothetical protein